MYHKDEEEVFPHLPPTNNLTNTTMRKFNLTEEEKRAIEIAQEKGIDIDAVGAYIYLFSHGNIYPPTADEIVQYTEEYYVDKYDTLQEFAEYNAYETDVFPNSMDYVDWTKYIDYLFDFNGDFAYVFDDELNKYIIFGSF